MTKLTLSLKEGEPIEVMDIRDITIDFSRGVVRFNHYDESGPHTGEYELTALDDVDWETVENTTEIEAVLNTYQHRAIHNLPPKLPGQPDLTYQPELPKIVAPTEVKMPEQAGAE